MLLLKALGGSNPIRDMLAQVFRISTAEYVHWQSVVFWGLGFRDLWLENAGEIFSSSALPDFQSHYPETMAIEFSSSVEARGYTWFLRVLQTTDINTQKSHNLSTKEYSYFEPLYWCKVGSLIEGDGLPEREKLQPLPPCRWQHTKQLKASHAIS